MNWFGHIISKDNSKHNVKRIMDSKIDLGKVGRTKISKILDDMRKLARAQERIKIPHSIRI